MSIEEAFKLVIGILLTVLSYIGARLFSVTFENTRSIDKLTIELEQFRKITERIAVIESDVAALKENRRITPFKGNHHK